jgi:chromosome segregation ATPase
MEAAMNAANREHKDANLEIRNLQSLLDTITQDSRSQQQRSQQLEKEKETLQERLKEYQLASLPRTDGPSKPKAGHRRASSLSNFQVTALEQELREARVTLQKRDEDLRTLGNKLSASREEAIRAGNEKSTVERTLSARIEELQACIEEKEEEISCLRDQNAGSDREQELLDRIDEDEAKINALESMLRTSPDVTSLQRKVQTVEAELQRERRNAHRLNELNRELAEEKESLLHELQEARNEIAPFGREGPSDQ